MSTAWLVQAVNRDQHEYSLLSVYCDGVANGGQNSPQALFEMCDVNEVEAIDQSESSDNYHKERYMAVAMDMDRWNSRNVSYDCS